MERDQLLALLEANHSYPGDHHLQVVLVQDEQLIAHVLSTLATQVGVEHLDDRHVRVASKRGTYVSLRIALPVAAASDVLAVYDRLSTIEGLKTWF